MACEAFVAKVLCAGDAHYRDLPWRNVDDPYAVLVSEVMLQQTQVARVEGFWRRFLAAFPTIDALAAASPADVLALWQGRGLQPPRSCAQALRRRMLGALCRPAAAIRGRTRGAAGHRPRNSGGRHGVRAQRAFVLHRDECAHGFPARAFPRVRESDRPRAFALRARRRCLCIREGDSAYVVLRLARLRRLSEVAGGKPFAPLGALQPPKRVRGARIVRSAASF